MYLRLTPKVLSELKTLEWDIFNHDQIINLEIKKKSGSSINPDIHHSKVLSAALLKINN